MARGRDGIASLPSLHSALALALHSALAAMGARYSAGCGAQGGCPCSANQGGRASLDLLDTEQQLSPAENALAQTQRDQLSAVVTLYKALGGGWKLSDAEWNEPTSLQAATGRTVGAHSFRTTFWPQTPSVRNGLGRSRRQASLRRAELDVETAWRTPAACVELSDFKRQGRGTSSRSAVELLRRSSLSRLRT